MKLAVIGAGVLGLMSALELHKRGHEVVIYDKTGPFAEASQRSFAWLNANNKLPEEYSLLNTEGIKAHRRFQEEHAHGGVWFHQPGCVMVDFNDGAKATYKKRIETSQSVGYPVKHIRQPELKDLEPSINWEDACDGGLLFTGEGYLDNDLLGQFLVNELKRLDVKVVIEEVLKVTPSPNGANLVTSVGEYIFDKVLIAAGAHSGVLAENSGFQLPVHNLNDASSITHSFLGLTEPTNIDIRHVVITDRFNARPRHDGRMWIQVPKEEPKASRPHNDELLAEVKREMQSAIASAFGQPIAVEKLILSGRSLPADGLPIVGPLDDAKTVFGLVMHSGMTMAALMAQLISDELDGKPSQMLEKFRPQRFADGIPEPEVEVFNAYYLGKQ